MDTMKERVTAVAFRVDPITGRTVGGARMVPAGQLVAEVFPPEDFVVSQGGRVLAPTDTVAPGTVLAYADLLEGGGDDKDGWRLLAELGTIAASVGAYAIGGPWASSLVLWGGQQLINAFLQPDPTNPAVAATTYAFTGQGNPIASEQLCLPVVYGKTLVKPALKDRLVLKPVGDGSTELDFLFSCAGHYISGINDSTHPVYINDSTVETYNCTAASTQGTLDQSPLGIFSKTFHEYAENVILAQNAGATDGDWTEINTTETDAVGFFCEVTCPDGVYRWDGTDREMDKHSIIVDLQWKPHADAWGGGSTETRRITLQGQSAEPQGWTWDSRRDASGGALSSGQYDFRLRRAGYGVDLSADNDKGDTLYLLTLTTFTDDGYEYPGEALISVSGATSENLSGSLEVTAVVERESVYVYDADDTAWETRPASNPAWAVYDLLANGHADHPMLDPDTYATADGSTYGGGVPYTQIDYDSFEAWADFCDAEGIECHVVFDTATTLWEAVSTLATLGRASIIATGTEFKAVWDEAGAVSQLFGEGNIRAGSFTAQWLGQESRANRITVTYNDADNRYKPDSVTVEAENYDDAEYSEEVSLKLEGCTSYEQAYAQAVYLLRCNQHQTRVVSFETGADALACEVGDIIKVAHGSTLWGESGRVASARENLLDPNTGFETGDTTGWGTSRAHDTSEVVGGSLDEGTYCYHFISTSASSNLYNGLSGILESETTYILHARMHVVSQGASNEPRVEVTWKDDGGTKYRAAKTTTTGSWVDVSAAFTTGTNVLSDSQFVIIKGVGEAYVDAVMVEAGSVAGTYTPGTEITLDKDIAFVGGSTYTVEVRDSDDDSRDSDTLYGVTTTTTDTISTLTRLSFLPALYDVYVVELGDSAPLFRITSITLTDSQTRRIEAIEYRTEVFGADVTPDYSLTLPERWNEATSLTAVEKHSKRLDGSYRTTARLAWRASYPGIWAEWQVAVRDVSDLTFQWTGDWDSGTTYGVGDCVINDGGAYLSETDSNLNHEPPNATYWTDISGTATWIGEWAIGTTYAAGDNVIHDPAGDGVYYRYESKVAGNVGHEPDVESVYWREPLGTGWSILGITRDRQFLVDVDLIPNHTYEFALSAKRFGSDGVQAVWDAPKVRLIPEGRPNPSAVDFSGGQYHVLITLYWPAAVERDVVLYEVRDEDANWGTVDAHMVYRGAGRTCQFKYPVGSRTPTFYIRSLNTSGDYSTSSGALQVENEAPATPTGLGLTAGVDTVLATWTEVDSAEGDILGYRVYVDEVDGSTPIAYVTGTSYTYQGAPGTTYYVRVSAYDYHGEGSLAAAQSTTTTGVVEATIVDETPDVPAWAGTPLTTGTDDPYSAWVTADWGTASGASRYEVSLDTATGQRRTVVETTGTDYTFRGLVPGTTYYCNVRAVSRLGSYSSWAGEQSIAADTDDSAPDACSALAVAASYSALHLTWTLPSNADLATVEVWAAATNDRAGASKVGDSHSNFFVHRLGSYGTTRYYWLKAVDVAGNESAWYPSGSTSGVSGTTGQIDTADIADDAITASQILAGTITADELAADCVTAAKIAAGAVEAEALTIGGWTNPVGKSTIAVGHMDGTANLDDGTAPESGSVYTPWWRVGRFGGSVAVERATTNIMESDTDFASGWTLAGDNDGTVDWEVLDERYGAGKIAHVWYTKSTPNSTTGWFKAGTDMTFNKSLDYVISWKMKGELPINTQIILQGTAFSNKNAYSAWYVWPDGSMDLGNGWTWYWINVLSTDFDGSGSDADLTFPSTYVSSTESSDYYITEVQVEQGDGPTSFVATSRAAGQLEYDKGEFDASKGTVSFWFNPAAKEPESTTTALWSIGEYSLVSPYDEWLTVLWGAGTPDTIMALIRDGSNARTLEVEISLTAGTWYWVCLTWDTDDIALWVGEQGGSLDSDTSDISSFTTYPGFADYDSWFLGYAESLPNPTPNALFDEVRIDTEPVTAAEAMAMFLSSSPYWNPNALGNRTASFLVNDSGFVAGNKAENTYLEYDYGTGALSVVGGTITSTSGSTQRIVIDPADNTLTFYDDSDDAVVLIDDSIYGSYAGMAVIDGIIESRGSSSGGIRAHKWDGNGDHYFDMGPETLTLTVDSTSPSASALKVVNGVGTKFDVDWDGNVDISAAVTIATNLDVDGTANLDNVDIDGTLDVAGNADFHADVDLTAADVFMHWESTAVDPGDNFPETAGSFGVWQDSVSGTWYIAFYTGSGWKKVALS